MRFPNFTKSRSLDQRSSPAIAELEPALACYPNPAKESTFVTYPSYLDGSAMAILDAKGELVQSITLNGSGVLQLATGQLPDGLYLVNITGTTFSTKLTVQH